MMDVVLVASFVAAVAILARYVAFCDRIVAGQVEAPQGASAASASDSNHNDDAVA